MKSDLVLLAHGDLGIPPGFIYLLMLLVAAWGLSALLVLVNGVFILTLKIPDASKGVHSLSWVISAILLVVPMLGFVVANPLLVPPAVVAVLLMPIIAISQFVVLCKRMRREMRASNETVNNGDKS